MKRKDELIPPNFDVLPRDMQVKITERVYRLQLSSKWCKCKGETWPEAFERKRNEEREELKEAKVEHEG